jgi:hypothetical protein
MSVLMRAETLEFLSILFEENSEIVARSEERMSYCETSKVMIHCLKIVVRIYVQYRELIVRIPIRRK